MTQKQLVKHISDTYGVEPDRPFPMDGTSCVFRHADNRKWFALTMNVTYRTIGIARDGRVDILNVKCDPILIGSVRGRPGFRPAYHMNKDKWLTVLLDGSAAKSEIEALLAMSYDLTRSVFRKRRKPVGTQTDDGSDSKKPRAQE
ncbi:MAG: MmcQ/YjbR family DNA-binding protein [Clostridia bacterium]|nr:MmcQ/YjbR family DNA-binding protein [Clostridia bacterium]